MTDDDFLDIPPGGGNAARLLERARSLYDDGAQESAASAIDLAYGLAPEDPKIATLRSQILDSLAVAEHGLTFRYVPGRQYEIGSDSGDPDERPVHVVRLDPFWLSSVPVSWDAFCTMMGWPLPGKGMPPRELLPHTNLSTKSSVDGYFFLREASKIRLQYCENSSDAPYDWHRAAPGGYDLKPMVAVAWQEVEYLAEKLSNESIHYRLPTEAEWEAGARGGLLGCRHPWGNAPPSENNCDFDRYEDFSIQPSCAHPPNGYGLYSMCGGVWEWTSDWYDAMYYSLSPNENPAGPASGSERVIRGGSWADCADVVTVSYRSSRDSKPFWDAQWGRHLSPNIGFRLCRSIPQKG